MTIAEIIQSASERWDTCQGAELTLLRFAVLRDLYRQLHAQRSHLLAHDNSSDFQLLDTWMERVRNMNSAASLAGSLSKILDPGHKVPRQEHPLPQAFFEAIPSIPKAKLERKDREWEKAIATEAYLRQWTFVTLSAWVALREAEKWHGDVVARLWPQGILLFVEPGEPSAPLHSELWHGLWYFVTSPSAALPTALPHAPEHPLIWQQLFPPKP